MTCKLLDVKCLQEKTDIHYALLQIISVSTITLFIQREENNTTSLCQMLTILFFYKS
jgi:hypothetical protein